MSDNGSRPKRVIWAGYVVATTIMIFFITDVVAVGWPFVPGERSWRYGMIGLISGALYHPFIAALMAFAAASAADSRVMVTLVAVGTLLAAVLLLAAAAIFSADLPELRQLAAQGANSGAVDRAMLQVLLKLGVGSCGFVAIGALAAAQRKNSRKWSDDRRAEPGVLVAASGKPARLPE